MKRVLSLMLLGVAVGQGCNCEDNLSEQPDAHVDPPDAHVERPDAAVLCSPDGVIVGKVCAPDAREFVAGAVVTLHTVDCGNAPIEVVVVSGADGAFRFENIPAGTWSMEIEAGGFIESSTVMVQSRMTTTIADNELCLAQDVRIAVVTGDGDRIEDLLGTLGVTFTLFDGKNGYQTSAAPFLASRTQMAEYDIIFIDCAAATTGYTIDLGTASSMISQNLREYVLAGGSLYASDWAIVFQAMAFPEQVRPRLKHGGSVASPFDANELMGYAPQTVNADVVDPALRNALQRMQVEIVFPNAPGARSSHFGLLQDVMIMGSRVLVRADVKTCPADDSTVYCDDRVMPGPTVSAPLAIGFKLTPVEERGGNVYYTAFHNIAQPGQDVSNILKYIIFHL